MKKQNRKKNRKNNLYARLQTQIKEHKSVFAVYIVLRLLVIVSLVLAVLRGDYESVFICSLVLGLFLVPAFVENSFGIELPSVLQIIILLFIFAAEMLGELQSYYLHYPYWDTMLHTLNGFLCAAVGYSLVDLLNRSNRFSFSMSPLYLAIVAFCFSMTVGVLWEFFEFAMDMIFRTDMQKDTVITLISSTALDPSMSNRAVIIEGIESVAVNGAELGIGGYLDIGLLDTMEDMFVNFIGAVIFSVIGFIDAKSPGHSRLLNSLLPRLRDHTSKDSEKTASAPEQDAE